MVKPIICFAHLAKYSACFLDLICCQNIVVASWNLEKLPEDEHVFDLWMEHIQIGPNNAQF